MKVNGILWDKFNKSEFLIEEDVSSQITGSNKIFVVSKIPIYDGANKNRLAQRNIDITVIVSVAEEDVTEQFAVSGTDTLIVVQHRPLISPYNIYAVQLVPNDVLVEVDSGSGYESVEVSKIESMFGKVFLSESPPIGSNVRISYSYKARVLTFNANNGTIELREYPQIDNTVKIFYFYLSRDGWTIQYNDELQTNKIIFDQQKQTNHIHVIDEDVSSQFIGIPNVTHFFTKNKNLIPPRAKPNTSSDYVSLHHIVIKHNGILVTARNIEAKIGRIDLGFVPKKNDTVTISYHYRSTGPGDIISVNYLVSVNKCRKCKRTGQVNDYDYDKLGEVVTVQKEKKMLQDLIKMTLAIKGSNKAHLWWGTSLISFIGTTRLPDYYKTKFKGELIEIGEKIKDLQTQQSQYQQVDDEEFFSFLENITVEQSNVDPNFYEIDAYVISQAGTSIQLDTSLYFSKPLIAKE